MKSCQKVHVVCAVALCALLMRDLLSPTPLHVLSPVVAAEEAVPSTSFFASLVQLTEAVLAPAWGTGGYAYTLDGLTASNSDSSSSTLRPVCVHTRASSTLPALPFTFSMFDAEFSPLYLVSEDHNAANAIGQLDIQRGCYVSLTTSTTSVAATEPCIGAFASHDAQCAGESVDALGSYWTAGLLTSQRSAGASGLSAAELFTVFLNDYLPQRAWLRGVIPRVFDVLETARQTAEAFHKSSALADQDEVDAMQRAVMTEWNSYLWNVYGPQLRRKWDLLYRYAVATLTTGGLAASMDTTTTTATSAASDAAKDSITGVPGPVHVTTCPLVDAWMQLRYQPSNLTRARLSAFMESALEDLADSLESLRGDGSGGGDDAQIDDDLFDLVRSVYCVATTNLFSLTALVDRPFLNVLTSVWIDPANHSDSWAWQTMQPAVSAAAAASDASAFQSSTAAQVNVFSASLTTPVERTLVTCLAGFLDPTAPLTSAAFVSPSDCVRVYVETRTASAGLVTSLTVLFDLEKLTSEPQTSDVPGMARYESDSALVSGDGAGSETLRWTLVQEKALAFTAQTSVFTPSVSPTTTIDPCQTATQHFAYESAWDWAYECAAGTYLTETAAVCATCPSACATAAASAGSAAAASPAPVYCPGDGLMHGCPPRPVGAFFTGSSSGAQTGPLAVCRYACENPYTAPLNFSCLSVRGMFYNTSAAGNADANNGGGLSPCFGPASMLQSAAHTSSLARLYALVGSGATDAPLTCPFTLLYRATSSAITLEALQRVGVASPASFLLPSAATAARASSSSSAQISGSGATWEVEVQLNATQLYALHTALLASQQSDEDTESAAGAASGTAATTTTIAHELLALQRVCFSSNNAVSRCEDVERILSWYLVSTYTHTGEEVNAFASDSSGVGPTPSTSFSLRFLLNLSMMSSSSPTASSASSSGKASAASSTPAPSSLVVLSASWLWTPWVDSADPPLRTSTYRVVLSRATSTVSFVVDDTIPLQAPVPADYALWAPVAAVSTTASPTSPPSQSASFILSVGGWVAGYAASRQWILLAHTSSTSSTASDSFLLPVHYDYVPGMVTRLSTAPVPIDPFQDVLQAAEGLWREHAAAAAAAQGQHVAQLTALADLALYTASTTTVASNVSAALQAMALRETKGLDSVCRTGFGVLPTALSPAVCAACDAGSYTRMNATAGHNWCACLPQLVRVVTAATDPNQQVSICQRRKDGPAMPREGLTDADTLYIDADVVNRDSVAGARIPLGWYAAAAPTSSGGEGASSLNPSVKCLYGLTSFAMTATNTLVTDELNASVSVQYTTGLGGEVCEVKAAARSGALSSSSSSASSTASASALLSAPTYTAPRLYNLRLEAYALTADTVTLLNNSALSAKQTVLAVGVRGYALLPPYAVRSLLLMNQLTEYHLSFLAYVMRSATVTARLKCGQTARNLAWAMESALDTFVLVANLSEVAAVDCTLTFRVMSATAATSEATVPYSSWPYSYLRVPSGVSPSTFFKSSPTLTYTVRRASAAEAAMSCAHSVLSEVSSFVMAVCIVLVSLILAFLHAISDHAPSLDLRPWRRYERAVVKTLSSEEDC